MASIRVCTATLAALETSSTLVDCKGDRPAAISIPAACPRRVSFNLGGNRVLQLPSNTALAKITLARSRHLEAEGSPDHDAPARTLLPRGASAELLDSQCNMTALCVQRGHIRPMNADAPGAHLAPPRGVLKPFTPSPVNLEFLLHGLPESASRDPSDDEAEPARDEREREHTPGRKARKTAAKKKKSRGKHGALAKHGRKRAAGKPGAAALPGALPLPRPIPITM
ncbi:hypothetical protein LPJ63_003563 [Coemansia sp. RSA 2711]|nr:hypothetical protein LPJ63_003563 [Coemansia sp. RSA 2711]KAJ2735255.1 hypothetical protein H4R23_002239 [Coemansia sp. Cherry 401B]